MKKTSASVASPPLVTPAVAARLEQIAWLMDRSFTIPGTKLRIGLDALLGIFPVGGDVLTGVVQIGVVLVALMHYHVPRHVAVRMMFNVLLDIGVGAIPILGDLFDMAFKANTRNLALLEKYHPKTIDVTPGAPVPAKRSGTPWRYILPIVAILVAALSLVVIGFVVVIRWILGW